MIPLTAPDLGPDEADAVAAVLRSGRLAQGMRVQQLERRWADFIGTRHAVAVANVTVALMAIHAGLGLGPGDEVITVSHTFPGTVSAILATGATPVFVDIEPDTFLIDAKRIETAITPRTRAICPVHLFGLPADMDMIRAIADRHGMAVVEDAGPADGAAFRSRRVGSFGHGAARLYPTDDVATGDGGLVTTDDDRLASWIRAYRHAGPDARGARDILGMDYRMSELQAAIGLVRVERLESMAARRRALAGRYDAALEGLPVRRPVTPTGRSHAFHQYVLDVGHARDLIAAELFAAGVEVGTEPATPVHRQPYVEERGIEAFLPLTDQAAASSLALPMYADLDERDQDVAIAALRTAVSRLARSDAYAGSTAAAS
jgi:dTDP-4-amino-4,6-dideoxygalactose transaminase